MSSTDYIQRLMKWAKSVKRSTQYIYATDESSQYILLAN